MNLKDCIVRQERGNPFPHRKINWLENMLFLNIDELNFMVNLFNLTYKVKGWGELLNWNGSFFTNY